MPFNEFNAVVLMVSDTLSDLPSAGHEVAEEAAVGGMLDKTARRVV